MVSTRGSDLRIRVTSNHMVYIVNMKADGAAVLLEPGTLVAGFYKGRWWHDQNQDEEVKASYIPFRLNGADDLVLHGGSVQSVGDLISMQREKTSPLQSVPTTPSSMNPPQACQAISNLSSSTISTFALHRFLQ